MDFTLIVGILLFILVVYLIFKFVKKIVFAVISVFILIILIIAGIGGLAYLDFRSLSAQQDFVVNVVYAQDENLQYGIQIPFNNSEPQTEEVSGISNIKTLDVDEIDKDSGEFIIIIDDMFYLKDNLMSII
jgi:energy-coupling factor transporter transmembrane protein EcfT